MIRIYLFVLGLFISIPVLSQSADYNIQVRRFSDAAWIRWNAATPDIFKMHAPKGFALYRTTVSRDGIPLESEERFQLNTIPIRWDTTAADSDTMLLLKELFFFSTAPTTDVQTMLRNKEMKDLAFIQGSLFLLQDFKRAMTCGLGWEDGTAKSNETYLYELRLWQDTGRILATHYLQLLDDQAVPVVSLKPEQGRNTLLSIEQAPAFWGYHIEKAIDTPLIFTPLSELPYVNASKSPQLLVLDSQNIPKGKIFYRVAGMDAFGLRSAWSDTMHIHVLPEIYCPAIENLKMNGDTAMEFSWLFPDSVVPYLKSWGVAYCSAPDETFSDLQISKTAIGWKAKWPAGLASIYLRPSLTDLNNKEYFGPIAFMQPIDSMPPPLPVGVYARCDSSGVVKINWNAAAGAAFYRLYRANFRDVEFTDHSHVYFTDTFFSDTLDLNTLQDTVYYAVTALDSRYNESGQSMFACAVFDKIPPPPPAFLGYELTEKGYMIRWTGSRDAASYNLHKLGEDLQTISTDSVFYLDSTGKSEEQYTYYLTAKDRNANVSEASAKLVLRFPYKSVIPAVPKPVCFNDTQKRKCYVMWEYPDLPNISHFRIMLKSPGKSKTVATAQSNERQYCMHGFLKSEADEIEIIAYTKDGMKSR